jgi:hypothetical protein
MTFLWIASSGPKLKNISKFKLIFSKDTGRSKTIQLKVKKSPEK